MPTDYQPIPTPLRQRWKVFRTEFLPLGVLLLSAVAVYMLWDLEVTPVGLPGEVYGQHSEVPAPRDRLDSGPRPGAPFPRCGRVTSLHKSK